MKMEIKLEKPIYCNGCPFLNLLGDYCTKYKTDLRSEQKNDGRIWITRCNRCYEENGYD